MIVDADLLGLGSKHWPIKATNRAIKSLRSDYAGLRVRVGVFTDPGLFGPPEANLKKLVAGVGGDTIAGLRLQLKYTSEHTLNTLKSVKQEMARWEKFRNQTGINPDISHTTEHRSTDKLKLTAMMQEIAAHGFRAVNNPLPQGAVIPQWFNETHEMRTFNSKYYASQDGMGAKGKPDGTGGANGALDIDNLGWLRKHAGAEARFVWCSRFNLRDLSKKYSVPKVRTDGPPNWQYIRAILEMGIDPGPIPGGLPAAKKFTEPCLYKTMSDDTPGTRLHKPVLIVKEERPFFNVVTVNGKCIGRFDYYGTYNDNTHRYYSGYGQGMHAWSFEIAQKALDVSGSPWVCFESGNFRYGWIHPCFRWGYFRA